MRYTRRIKPISWLKANAAEVLADLCDTGEPLLITQNGEAKAVLQDVGSYERTQQTLALLKLLALGQQDIDAGRLRPAEEAFERVLARKRTAETAAD